jgi:hypothetical protein
MDPLYSLRNFLNWVVAKRETENGGEAMHSTWRVSRLFGGFRSRVLSVLLCAVAIGACSPGTSGSPGEEADPAVLLEIKAFEAA